MCPSQYLNKLLRPVSHRLEILPYTLVAFPSNAERVKVIVKQFERAIDESHEGLVMKLANAPYGLNERTETWVKLKPDYIEGVSDTLDVVIVGGYLGQGTVSYNALHHVIECAVCFAPVKGDDRVH